MKNKNVYKIRSRKENSAQHSPYSLKTITQQHPSWVGKTEFVAAEGIRASCENPARPFKCDDGSYYDFKSGISSSTQDSASYLSRTKGIPTIFMELAGQKGVKTPIPEELNTKECRDGAKDKTCFYFVRNKELALEFPFFIRIMELAAENFGLK